MQDLFNKQNQIMGAMDTLLKNFKKDGADRKTTAYVKIRLSNLEAHWQEFQVNHIKLCEFDDRTHEYFTSNYYQRAADFYNEAKSFIQKYLSGEGMEEKVVIRPATPLAGRSQQQPSPQPTSHSQGTNSKLHEMLRKQKSNFKAFARTLQLIDLETLSDRWELEDALKSLQSRWFIIDALHWEIDSEQYEENEQYEQTFAHYESKYIAMKKSINSKMWSQSHREKSTPQIDIPSFSGNYHQWESFKDLFVESIHNNNSLSAAQKMQYLKGKLKGEAEKLIQHLNISSDNYQISWDILNHRYNNKKLIFNSHVNILMSLPIMQHPSAASIKKIHDTANECLNAIKALGVDISTWDPLMVYILSNKLDAESYNDYVISLKNPRDLPTLQDLLDFLENTFTSLEMSKRKPETAKPSQQPETIKTGQKKQFFYKSFSSHQNNSLNKSNYNAQNKTGSKTSPGQCPVCKQEHGIFHCKTFFDMQPQTKLRTIEKIMLCKNCFRKHDNKDCNGSKCRVCKGNHNTLLHDAYTNNQSASYMPTKSESSGQQNHHSNNINVSQGDASEILLATALVKVQKVDGNFVIFRALIDQGSQASIITENAAQVLGLKRKRCKGIIFGVGAKENACKGFINIHLACIHSDFHLNTNVYIMNQMVNNLPNRSFPEPSWSHIQNIQLADPDFYKSRPIDILLGADVYPSIIMAGIINENNSLPIAQQTRFGWILCGNTNTEKAIHCNVILANEEDLSRFWSIEDVSDDDVMSSEDQYCMKLYQSTTERRSDGNYVVRLPLHPDVDEKLGQSKTKAVAQFYQLEKKFKRQENIAKQYRQFIAEYEYLGHMHSVNANVNELHYYLPHHCVHRADSTTTSLRVVFNASGISDSGLSLNDLMYRGPNLQRDLLSLILMWRQYPFAFIADIEKMFRQIYVHSQDQRYQQIVWRYSTDEPLQDYQLATVTYGTKAAPFLAMMTLRQLASDESRRYPEAATALQEQFYMDDYLGGSYSLESGLQLQQDLIDLLRSGGFNLRKWLSNEPKLCQRIENEEGTFDFRYEPTTKALGLTWDSKQDHFTFQSKISKNQEIRPTKRILLSEISKIFDPLGWLSPVVIQLKLLFQEIWTAGLQWDEPVPDDIYQTWIKLRSDIENINKIKIPRWIGCNEGDVIELHGFCDASVKAYAAMIYARIQKQGTTSVILLTAKTKVVPLSKSAKKISLPRLELCGALLLSNLMSKVTKSLNNHKLELFGWCDSTAVLGWLQGETSRWKPFVANRVTKIIQIIGANSWNYVQTKENPADCASRGLTVEQLLQHNLWWSGPNWLLTYKKQSENKNIEFNTELEIRKLKQINVAQISDKESDVIHRLIHKHSNFTRAYRLLAWILRMKSRDNNKLQYLCTDELRKARLMIVKYVQYQEFFEDINHIKKYGTCKQKSKLLPLNPFLDTDGLLRVKGRLLNSNLSEDMKHPLIIPYQGRLTDLIIDQAHKQTFHGGARLTQSLIREQFWILSGNRAVKKHIFNCVICRKHKPIKQFQMMGDLPEARTTLSRPFFHTGVDYTGFVEVKANKGRGIKTCKGYIAVFVCMVTKAIHLELVSDLSSSAFLAALRRMAARRGTPGHIYSDNGTNFVGAQRALQTEFINLKQSVLSDEFLSEISEMQIKWHFNAPSWPSAGGLWEAAVKSLKHHMRRVIGDQKLTYEEFSTLLSQLESCLNSRPLCAITEDPNDIDYLTPAHFLSSGPVLTIVETERDERTRWHLLQKTFSDIWKRWKTEYLTQLSIRQKWQKPRSNIQVDDVVVIHDANLPAGKWALGRVVDTHPGKDGLIRVVSVKTKSGIIKRPVVKLSILPVHNTDDTKTNLPSVEETHSKRKRGQSFKTSCLNFVTTIFMLFMLFMTSSVQGAYNISSLPTNNTIYFDKMTDMRLIQDNWKLIVYYDMQPYWDGIRLYGNYIQHLETQCTLMSVKSHCDVILLQLRHEFMEFQQYDRLLPTTATQQNKRTRRALINGIGYLANSLFGVLDERFAEQYEKDISSLKNNQNHLVTLWKKQTSIIETENNMLKRVENVMERQHKIFNQHLNKLENAAIKFRTEIVEVETSNEFLYSSIIINHILNNLKNIQNNLLSAISDLHIFNIHVLTPEQLRNELSIISGQLSKELSIPIDNIQTDLSRIYKIMKVKSRVTQQYLIFEVQIPLVNRDSYDIYKTFPVLYQKENFMVNVQPISPYLAMNIKKDTYFSISEYELQKCIELDNSHLCEVQKPIYQRVSDDNFCVIEHQTGKCKTFTSHCQITWTELVNVNTFLFTCCGQCSIRIICGDQISHETFQGVNIVALGNDCVIKGDTFTITSHQLYGNELNIQPDVLLVTIAPVNKVLNISLPVSSPINETHDSRLDQMSEQIERLKSDADHLEEETSISFHDVHHYVAIYGIAALVVAGAAGAWWRYRRHWSTERAGSSGPAAAAAAAPAAPALASTPPPPPRSAPRPRHSAYPAAMPSPHSVSVSAIQCDKCSGYSVCENKQSSSMSDLVQRKDKVTVPTFEKITFTSDS